MTIEELIEQLQNYPSDAEVVLSKDCEGNGFSPCNDFSSGIFVKESPWGGEFVSDYCLNEHPEDYEGVEGIKCVVLWPTG